MSLPGGWRRGVCLALAVLALAAAIVELLSKQPFKYRTPIESEAGEPEADAGL